MFGSAGSSRDHSMAGSSRDHAAASTISSDGAAASSSSRQQAQRKKAIASAVLANGQATSRRGRLQHAQRALEASQLAFREKKQQLSDAEHEQRVADEAVRQAEADQQRLNTSGHAFRKRRRATSQNLQQGLTSWVDPPQLQAGIDAGRDDGVRIDLIQKAEAVLKQRQEQLKRAYDEVSASLREGSHRREEQAHRKAKAKVIHAELDEMMRQRRTASADNGKASSSIDAQQLLDFHRMVIIAHQTP